MPLFFFFFQMYADAGEDELPGEGETGARQHPRTRPIRCAHPAERGEQNRWIFRFLRSLNLLPPPILTIYICTVYNFYIATLSCGEKSAEKCECRIIWRKWTKGKEKTGWETERYILYTHTYISSARGVWAPPSPQPLPSFGWVRKIERAM